MYNFLFGIFFSFRSPFLLRSHCPLPYNAHIESAICSSAKIVSFKTLRLCNISRLEKIYERLEEQGSNVYILHLVRDPRAMIASGLMLEIKKDHLQQTAKLKCDHIAENMKDVRNIWDGLY